MLFPSSVDLPNPGIKTALWADSLLSEPPEKPQWRETGAQAPPPQMMGGSLWIAPWPCLVELGLCHPLAPQLPSESLTSSFTGVKISARMSTAAF